MSVPGRDYSSTPLPRIHRPRRQSEAVAYRPCLRIEFGYTCAYCVSHEAEVARGAKHGLFEVEHFRPEHAFGHLRTVYANLMWACAACNRAKSGKWPSAVAQARGSRFVDPCAEALSEHLQIVELEVVPRTAAGEYMIDELNLNSFEHRTRRKERKQSFAIWKGLKFAIETNDFSPAERLEMQAEAMRILELLLGSHAPSDVATTCKCVL